MADLEAGNFQLDYLLQFKDDFYPDHGGEAFKDPADRISVKPWHKATDWEKR